MSDRPKEVLDEVARIAQEHGDYDDHRPTLFAVVDAGAPPEDGVYRPAARADLLAALNVEWWCAEYEGGWTPKACTSPDEAKDWEHGGCHWAVKP